MKLKKIASLALAGIMAVSMLAGCGDNANGGNNNNGGETNTATGVAAAFNEAQIAGNAVKVEFTNSSALNSYLAEAVKRAGQKAANTTVETELNYVSGIADKVPASLRAFANESTDNDNLEDGMKIVQVDVYKAGVNEALNEAAAVKYAANKVNEAVAALDADNYVKNSGVGSTYYKYGYTGEASMVSVVNNDGTTDYYFVTVITQTITETKK